MQSIITLLNQLANPITAFATVVLAILTAFLWFENRRLRNAGIAPEVVSYLLPHPDGNGAVVFVLANVGKGPAFNVRFSFSCDEADFESHKVLLCNDEERVPLAVLPQDGELKTLFGIGYSLFGKVNGEEIGPLKPFNVNIEYQDVLAREVKNQRTVDIKQFSGLRGIVTKSNERRIADSLESIEKNLAVIAHQSARFNAFVDITKLSDESVRKTKGD